MLKKSWFRRGVALLIAYIFYLVSWHSAFGNEGHNPATLLTLQGYLGSDEVQNASAFVSTISDNQPLVIVINSSSGELNPVLELAKKIYSLKADKHIPLVVYIEDNAVGPAAILPLLADDLYVSPFASWGDIPLGNEKSLSINILRSRVMSLIDPKLPHANILRLIAAAMCDPSIVLVDDKGWRMAKEGNEEEGSIIKTKGETLVINHNQLNELGLVKGQATPEAFQSLYSFNKEEEPTMQPLLPSIEGRAIPPKILENELKKHIVFNPEGPNIIGHILIDDRTSGINQATWLYVKSAIDSYKKIKPICVILELNTPGGEVFAAQKISDALKELDTQLNIPVIAYINNWAISAGAMLAYSCRFIAVAKDASMGAAEPIVQDSSGKMEVASEKINSALRADFANRARFFSRDPFIAEAMVDKDTILVRRHGKIIKLTSESQIRTTGADQDEIISSKGKLLTLDTEQLMNFGVADILVPPTKTEPLIDEEMAIGKWPANKMALFHLPFFDEIPNAFVESYRMDWKTGFFAILASPIVSSLLFLGVIVGFYLEFTTPGFAVAGTVAITCLFLIILSSFSLEIGNWLELILLLVGLGVLLVELFILPTFGLLGFIGIIFFLMGLFGMMLPGLDSMSFEFDSKTLNAAGEVFFERLAWLCGTLVVAFCMIVVLARFVTPKLVRFSRFVLKGNEQEGYSAVDVNPADFPALGSLGVVAMTLRPAGKVIVSDKLYDAMSTGNFIEKGTTVKVVRIEGGAIIVSNEKLGETF